MGRVPNVDCDITLILCDFFDCLLVDGFLNHIHKDFSVRLY